MADGKDQIDMANEVAEIHRDLALQQRRPEGPQETGVCLACEEPVATGRRWCDASCRDQWQKDQR